MKITYLFLAFILSSIFVKAQQKTDPANDQAVITFVKDDLNWYDLQRQPFPVLQGQGWPIEQKGIYGRLPVRAKEKVRAAIWTLSEQCAGLTVRFRTNAAEIKVKYQVSDTQSFPHMSATGVSGLDLYTSNDKGKEVWSAGGYLFGDTIKYTFRNLNSMSSGSKEQEYQLFLPLYNHVKWMTLGLPKDAGIAWVSPSVKRPIVIYGTSIAQGACASRPGMAWTGILNRELPYPFINFGFSGNGILEKEVLSFINEIDAKLYILDCLPNLVVKKSPEIETSIVEAVRQIRALHKSPVLLVEHAGYTDGQVDKDKYESYTRANKASKAAFDQLKKEGVQNIFYLSCEEIKMPMDGMVDGVHPTDFGMRAYADAYEKVIREILRK